jgi:hypothetical protein
MALHFMTTDARKLLAASDARIAQTDPTGKITTWEKLVHERSTYYTHKANDWARAAYFKPVVKADRLTFNIIKPDNKNVATQVYGYYHGHLTETFLNHFDDMFTYGSSSARPDTGDVVS